MKRNIRAFSMILALLCVMSMIPMMTVSAEETNTVEGLVDLSSYADGSTYTAADGTTTYTVVKSLATLQANATMTTNVILGADIDCKNAAWTAIALSGYTFDGNGYAIYGMKHSVTANLGLFGGKLGSIAAYQSGQTSVIRNLTVGLPESRIQMSNTGGGNSGSGALLGDINKAGLTFTFENVSVYADITTPHDVVGGFVGLCRIGTLNFTNCKFYGSIDNGTTGTNPAGGFIGEAGARSGLVTVNMTNCTNYGAVKTATAEESHAGGFVGKIDQKATTTKVTITNSVNAGSINGMMAGGFIGYQKSDNSSASVGSSLDYCLNVGYIEGSQFASGLVGYINDKNSGTTMKNSVNLGALHVSVGTKSYASANGLTFRYVYSTVVENCGSFATATAAGSAVVAMSRSQSGWGGIKATNLHYTEIAGAADLSTVEGYGDATAMTLEEGIAWTNELLGDKVGKVVLNNSGTGAVLAAPVFAGVQESNVEAGKIRLVATLNNSLNYSAVGFTVELIGGGTITRNCNSVYKKLLSTDSQGFASAVTAEELYGTYLYALAIEGIPTEGTVTLKITPYGMGLDQTTIYTGNSYNVVYTNGAVAAITLCD